jgi:RimJ/RimL family protein N-acetyltransferase
MSVTQKTIPSETIEAVARSLFKETIHYGFQQVDYLKFVNVLLEMSLRNGEDRYHGNNNQIIYYSPRALTLPLVSERVSIREYHDRYDRPIFQKWIEEKESQLFLLSRVTAKIANIDQLVQEKSNILSMITLTDNTPIGMLAFLDHDVNQGKAELRKLIGEPNFRGKGLAKEATRLWIQYGIGTLGLRKIYLNTLDTNIRNIKLNEELGFRVEGILRNECLIDGEYRDILKMALWSDEFKVK